MVAPDYSSEDNDDAENTSNQGLKSISGDDLGDSFSLEEQPRTKKGWVDEILESRDVNDSETEASDSSGDSETAEDDNDEGSDEDNKDGENNLSLQDWEQSDDDNLRTDVDVDEEEEEEEHDDEDDDDAEEEMGPRDLKVAKNKDALETSKRSRETSDTKRTKTDDKHVSTRPDLPYLIEAPKSFEEFSALLDSRSKAEVMLIITRIRASNAIKLAAENRKKMQV